MIFGNAERKIFKVAIYIRLSREDGDKQESESIANQRAIIMRYIKENNLVLVGEYVDDGVSGTTFDRPGFSRMIVDIENGLIDMVITKDLSRLGRDYIKTGFYIENYFPEHNVRYVAITDGIDTFVDSTNNDITPFKAIMNDMYAKDISKKIRSVRKEKQKTGEYMCTYAPYGYKKDPDQKNHLIVDENVRSIVEKIFELYSQGNGTKYIQNYLNERNIPSPLSYIKNLIPPKKWNDVTILNILKNEVYIGNTVSNKKTKLSYKSKKRVIMPKNQYIVVEDTHEPIINKELYEDVKYYLDNRDMNKKNKYEFLFRGLLRCHTCNRRLAIGSKLKINGKIAEKPIPYITCSGSRVGKCPNQHMNYEKFETEMISYLKEFCKLYTDKDSLINIYKKIKNSNSTVIEQYRKELEKINSKISKISDQIDSIYFDKLNKVILESDYLRYSKKILGEREHLETKKASIIDALEHLKNQENSPSEQSIDNIIDEFLNCETITKATLFRLIDKIEIDENKNVYVYFNFTKLNIINESINEKISFKELCKRDKDTYYRKEHIPEN